MRILKLDPRPPTYDSVAEATQDDRAAETLIDDCETAQWRAIPPDTRLAVSDIAFVDGVERRERMISAEGEGWPIPGMLVSYAAGAICPLRAWPLCHVAVERRIILAGGARPPTVSLHAHNTVLQYRPAHHAEPTAESLDRTLKELRAQLEAQVVRTLIAEGTELTVVDGRLPPAIESNAVGLIKTPHRFPVTKPEHIEVLIALKTGERSPVFVRRRSDRSYYSWFVCLRRPGPLDLALSGLAMMEMDDSVPLDEALRTADLTAAVLPPYASTPARDDRAPQNLLPVGQLERELRHRLGDAELLRRLMLDAFTREAPRWDP